MSDNEKEKRTWKKERRLEDVPSIVHQVRCHTAQGKLFDPKDLIYRLGWDNVSDSLFRELVHDQYRLAVRQSNSGWIRDARYYSGLRFVGSPDWVEEVLPEVALGKSRSMHSRSRSPVDRSRPKSCDSSHGHREVLHGQSLGKSKRMHRSPSPVERSRPKSPDSHRGHRSGHYSSSRRGNEHHRQRSNYYDKPRRQSHREVSNAMEWKEREYRPGHQDRSRHGRGEHGTAAKGGRRLVSAKGQSLQITLGTKPEKVKSRSGQACPANGCNAVSKHIRRHVQMTHIPSVFWEETAGNDLPGRRLKALEQLAMLIIGRPGVNRLMEWADRYVRIQASSTPNSTSQTAMRAVCKYARWNIPDQFTIAPVNSPAALIHWRIICAMMEHLSESQKRRFLDELKEDRGKRDEDEKGKDKKKSNKKDDHDEQKRDAVHSPEPQEKSSGEEVMDIEELNLEAGDEEAGVQDVIQDIESLLQGEEMDKEAEDSEKDTEGVTTVEAAVRVEIVSEDNLPVGPLTYAQVTKLPPAVKPRSKSKKVPSVRQGFDSHFHLDRTAKSLFGQDWVDLHKLWPVKQDPAPENNVEIVGGILVYCDPERYHSVKCPEDANFKVAVGIHPKKSDSFSSEKESVLKELLHKPGVVALGEVGIDHSVSRHLWLEQEEVLNRVLGISELTKFGPSC
ncbi:uncharacterized protein LOC123531129 [Mercenaria mercenaria]|uniref:uncharacterized protein LOC123531129 n=1 Tax=Mercenaria mercenaria TaxID=6596 RepID=UPI00234E578C|nr:uncharacterized protein LOC123531129 [Mercenaria mercenaria]